MRREGRQRGWVRVYDRALVDPEGKRRAVHVVEGPAVANGGFIRAPRKPTNQSKSGGLRALGRDALAQEEEEPEPPAPFAFVPVKEEPEEPAPLGRRGVVGPEDYVADFDAVAAAIAERSVREEAERRRHAEELEALQWQQAVAANDKAEEWRRIRAEQAAKYIDLCSSGEED